jgi:uncharacterized protein YecA (UPF0149 family)
MHVPSQPLSEAEESTLRTQLEQSKSVSLPYARGVFTAIACDPTLQDPTDWLPLVLGSEVTDAATLQQIFSLLIRDRHAIAECLDLSQPYAPHPDEHLLVLQFCKGFVRVTQASAAWKQDTDAIALALPLAVLADYLPLESLRKLQPDMPLDEVAWAEQQRHRLPAALGEIFEHFAPLRAKQQEGEQQQPEAAPPKVGRNDPCPCNSGKKYKKCCGC